MVSDLTLVDSLLYENGAIRRHCREIGKLLGEQDTLFLPGKNSTQAPVEELARQNFKLEQVTMTIADSLENHRQLHDKLPPSLFGMLAEALEMEHVEMLEGIKKARLEMSVNLEELTRPELLARSLRIRGTHESACVLVEAHLSKEDAMLELLKRALRARQEPELQ